MLERCRNGVVSGLCLSNKTFVALDDRVDRVLNLPLADKAKCLAAKRSLLSSL